jgi:hypothetical protein
MKPKDRERMCTHCDGRIVVEADSCPYCGMPLFSESEKPNALNSKKASSSESLSSLYPPPYSNRNYDQMNTENKEFESKFKTTQAQSENPFAKISLASNANAAKKEGSEDKKEFLSLLLILLGSNLLTLGLMQAMFSEGGFLRLEWSSKYWGYYCLVAIPLIVMGMKQIKQTKELSKES